MIHVLLAKEIVRNSFLLSCNNDCCRDLVPCFYTAHLFSRVFTLGNRMASRLVMPKFCIIFFRHPNLRRTVIFISLTIMIGNLWSKGFPVLPQIATTVSTLTSVLCVFCVLFKLNISRLFLCFAFIHHCPILGRGLNSKTCLTLTDYVCACQEHVFLVVVLACYLSYYLFVYCLYTN